MSKVWRGEEDGKVFKPVKEINARGAFVFGCALIEYLVTRVSINKEMSRANIKGIFDSRREFVKSSRLFVAIVDVLEYDVDKFRASALEKIDGLEDRSFAFYGAIKRKDFKGGGPGSPTKMSWKRGW
jgi:hypothetical protein